MSDDNNVVNFKLAKLFRTKSPWETEAEHRANSLAARKALNEAIIDRVSGIPAMPMTDDDAANDPRNPIQR